MFNLNTQQKIEAAFTQNKLVCFFDIDGTLSNFHNDPKKAFADPMLVQWIYEMEKLHPGTVVFVTGRPLDEAKALLKLPSGGLLLDCLPKFNGIFNHGVVLYVNGTIRDRFRLTEVQQAYLEKAKNAAIGLVTTFYEKHLKNIPGVTCVNDASGIQVQFPDGTKGPLLEIKKEEGSLASFAFHYRILANKVKEKEALFLGALNQFETDHVLTDANPLQENGKKFFTLPNNSDFVREFAPPFDKGTMVKICMKQHEFKNRTCVVGAGDAAQIQGTDRPFLEFILGIDQDPAKKMTGIAIHVKHTGKKDSDLNNIIVVPAVDGLKSFLMQCGLICSAEKNLLPEEANASWKPTFNKL